MKNLNNDTAYEKSDIQKSNNYEKKSSSLKLNSFFAGIGGFDLGFEKAGVQVAMQCEINKFCQKILKRHWPEILLKNDITALVPDEIPDAEIWTGGFPCQDVSVARGAKERMGLKGKNSGLFYPFADLINIKKPKVLLLENVEGLLSSHNGQDFRVILETLSNLGYFIAWKIMNSRYYGAPQSRPRVFICAALNDPNIALSSLYENSASLKPLKPRDGFLNSNVCEVTGITVPEVAYCLAATSGRHTGTDWSRTYISYNDMVRRLIPNECEGLQGFPEGWTEVPETKGDTDTDRYHALGNAVAVPVINWIAERMVKALNKKNTINDSNYESLINYKDFLPSQKNKVRYQKLSNLHLSSTEKNELKWQAGGFVAGDECWDINVSDSPSNPKTKLLIDVISKDIPNEKYFLSPNAAEGILRRVYSQNRTLFNPLHDALKELAQKNRAEILI